MSRQNILTEFYNLHLEEKPPTEDERERLIAFFSRYTPSLLVPLTDEQKKQIRKPHLEFQQGRMPMPYLNPIGLQAYEAAREKEWFSSDDFTFFFKQYCEIKSLVDGYLNKEVTKDAWVWLNKQIQELTLQISVKDKRLKQDPPLLDALLNMDTIPLDQFSFFPIMNTRTHNLITGMSMYGISVDEIFSQIVFELATLLTGRLTIKRCEALATRKTPTCPNIFIPQNKEQRFCSTRCRMREYQREYRKRWQEELKEIGKYRVDLRGKRRRKS